MAVSMEVHLEVIMGNGQKDHSNEQSSAAVTSGRNQDCETWYLLDEKTRKQHDFKSI